MRGEVVEMGDLSGLVQGTYSTRLGCAAGVWLWGRVLWRVLLWVSCDVQAAPFVMSMAEKSCSLPGSRCGPSPTF